MEQADFLKTQSRKAEHLKICTDENVNSLGLSGFENIRIPHCALPEINYSDISLEWTFLGHTLKYPFLISSMTGGNPEGEEINQVLAEFAQNNGLAMGVGSQRVALENRSQDLFNLRKAAPSALLFANIGAVQLNYGITNDDCLWLVENLQAQGLILHLNPLQEAIQLEGNRNFGNLLKKISLLKKDLGSIPLILKETGCGLDLKSAQKALSAGVDVIDIAGFGGTHWGYIEGLRTDSQRHLGNTYREWGNPTVHTLMELRKNLPSTLPIIASGGLRSGLDAAKAFYLGADLVGLALPFLKAAQTKNGKNLDKQLEDLSEELKVALFCTGSKTIKELQYYGQ